LGIIYNTFIFKRDIVLEGITTSLIPATFISSKSTFGARSDIVWDDFPTHSRDLRFGIISASIIKIISILMKAKDCKKNKYKNKKYSNINEVR
jgi:hypothetical protein